MAISPEEFKRARRELGLSVSQCADMLGVQPLQIRRMEMDPSDGSFRPVMGTTRRLMQAFLDGYRPKDWPLPIDS